METLKKLGNFFRKSIYIFQKIVKNTKNIFKNPFFLNEAVYMFGLTYVFSRIYFLQFQFEKNYFLKFGQFLKSPPDSGDGDGDGDCDRHGEF